MLYAQKKSTNCGNSSCSEDLVSTHQNQVEVYSTIGSKSITL